MRRWLIVVIAAAAAPHAARAGGAAEELSAGGAPAGARWVGDKLAAIWDVDTSAQLRLDVSATRMYDGATGAASGEAYLGALSVVYSTDEHWSLRLNSAWSPEATTRATAYPAGDASSPNVLDEAMLTDAELRITASSLAFGAGLDYDSASDDMHALSASLSFTATYFHAEQEITGAHAGDASLDPMQLWTRCQDRPCDSQALAALRPQWVQLGQFALGASVTDTIDRDTDFSLDAAYYLYDRDPLQSGYHALSTLANSTLGSATSAPLLRDALAPSVGHRWGAVSAAASLSYAGYADGQQADLGTSLRIQYKPATGGSQRLKLYVKLGASTHVDAHYTHANAGSAGLGAQYSW
jgi:hypothetical protein